MQLIWLHARTAAAQTAVTSLLGAHTRSNTCPFMFAGLQMLPSFHTCLANDKPNVWTGNQGATFERDTVMVPFHD